MFRAPGSSAPSTPDSRRQSNGFNNPSTTPAGPPPASLFSGSPLTSGNIFSGSKTSFNAINSAAHGRPPTGDGFSTLSGFSTRRQGSATARSGFNVPSSSPPQRQMYESHQEDEEYSDEGDYRDREEAMDEDEGMPDAEDTGVPEQSFSLPMMSSVSNTFLSNAQASSPRGLKRSRLGESIQSTPGKALRQSAMLPPKESVIPAVAKSIGRATKTPKLYESDDLIMGTERLLEELDAARATEEELDADLALSQACQGLIDLWKSKAQRPYTEPGEVGPGEKANDFTRANYVASLVLQLHHPPVAKPDRTNRRPSENMRALAIGNQPRPDQHSRALATVPKVLLDWLNVYHVPYPEDFEEVTSYEEGPTAHERYWDTVYSAVLRGRLPDAIRLFKEADFGVAITAVEDGHDEPGYEGQQLDAIDRVIQRATELLEACPAVTDGDWDVRGDAWFAYRERIRSADADLQDFAEGESHDRDKRDDDFEAEGFGLSRASRSQFSVSTASRKAESKVPWRIYEYLQGLYSVMQGSIDDIIGCSGDWVEAVIWSTVWWDGEEEAAGSGSLAASRRSLNRSQRARFVDVNPILAYNQKLAATLARISYDTKEHQLSINTTNPLQVGLASVFEGNVEGVLDILRSWSMTVTSAVVEISSAGGWFPGPEGLPALRNGFDRSDLMVLSYGQDEPTGPKKDDYLVEYAGLLFKKSKIASAAATDTHGWELTFVILGRLDDAERGTAKIEAYIGQLQIDSAKQAAQVSALCRSLGLDDQAMRVSEKYADILAESTNDYGDALLFYARAHNEKKIKDVLDLLISFCLVQSMAYPASTELDDTLRHLIENPKQALSALEDEDSEAAQLLTMYLSGYATLRKFYDLRDEEVNCPPGDKPASRPLARKRNAASALVALINSADESIQGGLYDAEANAVVHVDALLPLLGEALVFANQSTRVLSLAQIHTVMRAIEDLQTVSSTIFSGSEQCLQSALRSFHGAAPPDLKATLRKSISNLTASSQFSMVGSSMLGAETNSSTEGSGVLVKGEVKRGWDWRKGMKKGASGKEVLTILKVSLAQELAKVWVEGDICVS